MKRRSSEYAQETDISEVNIELDYFPLPNAGTTSTDNLIPASSTSSNIDPEST